MGCIVLVVDVIYLHISIEIMSFPNLTEHIITVHKNWRLKHSRQKRWLHRENRIDAYYILPGIWIKHFISDLKVTILGGKTLPVQWSETLLNSHKSKISGYLNGFLTHYNIGSLWVTTIRSAAIQSYDCIYHGWYLLWVS